MSRDYQPATPGEAGGIGLKPVYLLADSQLLFWREGGGRFLDSVRGQLEGERPKAAYVGASNGDRPDFYSIFLGAMQSVGINDCRMIASEFSPADEAFLNEAELILLSGGSVERGWRAFERNGLRGAFVRRYYEGALLMGVSAGAVQLGQAGWSDGGGTPRTLFDTLGLVPFVVAAHDEQNDWEELKEAVRQAGGVRRGLGIPTGGGAAYHPDRSLEPIRHALHEIELLGGELKQRLLLPPGAGQIQEAAEVC